MYIPKKQITLALALMAFAILVVPVYSQTSTFTGASGTDANGNLDYRNPGNWSNGVPATATGGTALINDGLSVNYYGNGDGGGTFGGGDLVIANGGTLEVSNGSWTQGPASNNFIQLGAGGGDGNILVNGGTFNQGTASSNPFNVQGTGNTFMITNGAANFDNTTNVSSGLTWTQSGGTVTTTSQFNVNTGGSGSQSGGTANISSAFVQSGGIWTQSGGTANISGGGGLQVAGGTYTLASGTVSATGGGLTVSAGAYTQSGGALTLNGNLQVSNGGSFSLSSGTISVGNEADFNNTNASMGGGVLNITNLFTMANSQGKPATFNFSGGIINDEAGRFDGWFGPSASTPFNFTVGSTGILNFDNNNLSEVQGWVNAGDIAFNDTTDAAAFSVTQNGDVVSVDLLTIPEPSTYALMGMGALGIYFLRRKKVGLIS